MENETVWLSQQQMVILFDSTKQNISLHINNIFKKTERLTTANINALREQFVKDMQELYKEKGWRIGTDQQYEGEIVRLYEEKTYTWETNHHIDSELRALYCGYKAQEAWLSKQLSQARKDVRSTAKKIESMYPDSESIKRTACAQIR